MTNESETVENTVVADAVPEKAADQATKTMPAPPAPPSAKEDAKPNGKPGLKLGVTAGAKPAAKKEVGIRRVRMTVARVDPWSALKLSFLISVAIGIMIVIAAMILWFVLDSMHVWAQIHDLLVTLNSESLLKLGQFMEFGRVLSFAVVVGVIEIVLMTALGTLMAILYNVVSMLVGGVHIVVTDE